MKRVGAGIAAGLALFAAGFAFARERSDRGEADGATTSWSTTYTIWSVNPPAGSAKPAFSVTVSDTR